MASCRDVDEFTYLAFQFLSREEKRTGPGREPLEKTCGEMELCGPRGGGGWHCLTHCSTAVKAILIQTFTGMDAPQTDLSGEPIMR